MRSLRLPLVLAPFWLLIACSGDDGDSTGRAGTNGSGATSTGGNAGKGGTGPTDFSCRPRCEAKATGCGVTQADAGPLCSSLCTRLDLAQLTCLEKADCDALNDGQALTDCGVSENGGAGGTSGTGGSTTAGKGGSNPAGGSGGSGQGGAGQGGQPQGGAGSSQGGAGGQETGEKSPTTCQDKVDNDGDNFIDCDDFNCCSVVDCKTLAPGSTCAKMGGAGSGGSGQGGGGAGGQPQGGQAQGGAGSGQGGAGPGGQGGAATLQPGDPLKILLTGTVLTPQGPINGQVLVENDKITCVQAGTACSGQPGASGATVITTNGIISPGLIDMHNHVQFDIFNNDDWVPAMPYDNHNQWPNEPRYAAMLDVKQCFGDETGKPSWCPAKWDGAANNLKCELNKWGETKAVIAGTTSMVGLIGNISGCVGSLARSIGTDHDDLPGDPVQSTALVPDTATYNKVCANITSGATKSYVVHNGEGKPGSTTAKNEFAKLRATTPPDCLLTPQVAITHGSAFGAAEFSEMGKHGMTLVWSPRSNVSLYGDTADIPTALANNITLALGPDWSMGGSVNMLDEMRFADQWDNDHWNNLISPRDLFDMATSHAAKALALEGQIGSLQPGLYADLFVFGGDASKPYDALLGTTPASVRLVMVGGRVLYGDSQLKAAGPVPASCEDLPVCGASKFICVAESDSSNKLNQTLGTIKAVLDDALTEADTLSTGDAWSFAPIAPLTTCP